jgi:hypothetical protein
MADDPEKARRLAEALRANLRRRKAQARAADDAPMPSGGEPDGLPRGGVA